MNDPPYLFVYGTLRPGTGHPMSTFLERHARFLGRGKTPGRLYDLGSYPGIREALDESDWVSGDVYELTDPDMILQELDRYEGCGKTDPRPWYFERFPVPVTREDDQLLTCWVYFYRRDVPEERRITSGDYYRTDLQDFDWRTTL
jgi:gamma-glutamylcyclotransferase (GGCT)/AIG2-like uncharacterized protein YtfP